MISQEEFGLLEQYPSRSLVGEAPMLQGTPIWWGHWYCLLLLLLGGFTTQIPIIDLTWLDGIMSRDPDAGALPIEVPCW
jgi:hypothetical protein